MDFRHADPVGTCTVFNIKGNHYRLIAGVRYESKIRNLAKFFQVSPEFFIPSALE